MVGLIVPQHIAAKIHAMTLIQEANSEDERLPWNLRCRPDLHARWNKLPIGRLFISQHGWTPVDGGVVIALETIRGKSFTYKSVVLYADQSQWSKKLQHENNTRRRGAAIFQEVNGEWFMHCRFRDINNKGGYQSYKQIATRKAKTESRRWSGFPTVPIKRFRTSPTGDNSNN